MTNADKKSMEEKQEAYDRAKARIFSQEVCMHVYVTEPWYIGYILCYRLTHHNQEMAPDHSNNNHYCQMPRKQ